MDCGTQNILLAVAGLVLVYLLVCMYSVKVYRVYSPTCPACKESQEEWDQFKKDCMFKLIKPIDFGPTERAENVKLDEFFNAETVPTVVAVTPDGRSYQYEGDRTAVAYMEWVNGL